MHKQVLTFFNNWFNRLLNAGPPVVFENLIMQIKEVSNTNGVKEWWLGSGRLDFITLRYLIVVPDYQLVFMVFVKK